MPFRMLRGYSDRMRVQQIQRANAARRADYQRRLDEMKRRGQ